MPALFYVAYGLVCYFSFLVTFLYMIGAIAGLPLPRTLDAGPASPLGVAIAVDVSLLAAFGIQHSVMARASFKRLWTRVVPPPLERSTYVLASTLALGLIVWQWRPITTPVVWDLSGVYAWAMQCVFWLGWGIMLASSFMLDHFSLFGLRQSFAGPRGRSDGDDDFRTPLLYRYVRHPLYVGVLLGSWATPRMTAGHLLFAAGFTVYILIGIAFEERDLLARFGAQYARYKRQVGMLVPRRDEAAR